MTPDPRVQAVSEQVRVDLLDHLRDLQAHGPSYIREYVEAIVGPQTTRRPRPRALHPKLAALVRELALDAAAMDRRSPTSAFDSLSPRDNDRPLTLTVRSSNHGT